MIGKISKIRPDENNLAVFFRQYRESQKSRIAIGEKSLAIFEERASHRCDSLTEKLSISDREKIACALFLEIQSLEQRPELCNGSFSRKNLAISAGLAEATDPTPTKRLHELTIDPCKLINKKIIQKKKIDLYAKYENYKKLINAILAFSKENRGEICKRIFAGTSFEGFETDINLLRDIAGRLNKKILSVDRVFKIISPHAGLEDKFNEIANLKESAQKYGSVINWPFIDLEEPYSQENMEIPNWNTPYWPKRHGNDSFDTSDVRGGAMRILPLDSYNAILYLPRLYLGCAVYLNDWGINPDKDTHKLNEFLSEIAISRREIAELRLLSERKPSMIWLNDNNFFRKSASPPTFNATNNNLFRILDGEGHCWIAIYPAPQGGICPVLYWCQGEGGVHVCIINADTIHALSNFYVISGSNSRKITSVYERLHENLENGNLEIEWARTAFDLLRHPFSNRFAEDT